MSTPRGLVRHEPVRTLETYTRALLLALLLALLVQ